MHTIHKKYTVLLTMPIKFRISWFWTLCITSLCVETTQLHSYVAHLVRVCTALQRTQVPFPGHISGSSHWPVSPDPGDLMASTGTAFMCTPYMGLIIKWDLLCSDNKLQIPVLRYSKGLFLMPTVGLDPGTTHCLVALSSSLTGWWWSDFRAKAPEKSQTWN